MIDIFTNGEAYWVVKQGKFGKVCLACHAYDSSIEDHAFAIADVLRSVGQEFQIIEGAYEDDE